MGDHNIAAFKFISLAALPQLREPLMQIITYRWPAIGFLVLLLFIYFYFKVLDSDTKKSILSYSVLCGVLLGFMFLSAELFAAIILVTIPITTIFYIVFVWKKDKQKIKSQISAAILLIIIMAVIALTQGGVFANVSGESSLSKVGISLNVVESIQLLTPKSASFYEFLKTVIIEKYTNR